MQGELMELFRTIYGDDKLQYLGALVVANILLGTAASMKAGHFDLTLVASWLQTRVVPLMLAYGATAILALSNAKLAYAEDAAWVVLTVMLVGKVLQNVKQLGIPLPDGIARTK